MHDNKRAGKTNYHIKGCAPGLVLKQRQKATRLFIIVLCLIETQDTGEVRTKMTLLHSIYRKVNKSSSPLRAPLKKIHELDLFVCLFFAFVAVFVVVVVVVVVAVVF